MSETLPEPKHLLRAAETYLQLESTLLVKEREGAFGLYLVHGGAWNGPWWESAELLSSHASRGEAEKARAFLVVQSVVTCFRSSHADPLERPIPFTALLDWQAGRAKAALALAGRPYRGGDIPAHWEADPHWFCAAGHVSPSCVNRGAGTWLKNGCPRCLGPVLMGPAMTEEEFAQEVNASAPPVKQTIEGQEA